MALGGQRADLLPVGDELVPLQVDLRGVLGVGLLQALGLAAKSVHLSTERGEEEVRRRGGEEGLKPHCSHSGGWCFLYVEHKKLLEVKGFL